jgi:hypothetical protein
MQGQSERAYAAHAGLSRGAIQKAKTAGRLVLFGDSSIDAAASDKKREANTDPSKQRGTAKAKLKPVPEAALSAVGEILREQGLSAPARRGRRSGVAGRSAILDLCASAQGVSGVNTNGQRGEPDRTGI